MILPIIFSSLFGIFFLLYLIGYFKNISLMQRLTLPFLLPCSVGIVVPMLIERMPDSFHILVISSIGIAIPILQIWVEPFNLKMKLTFEHFLFTASNVVWILLFYSIFYIYKNSVFVTVLLLVIYVGSIVFCSINLGIKSINQIIKLLFLLSICFFLNYVSVISLIYSYKIYSILLLIGTILLIGFIFTSLSTRFKEAVKHSKIILNMLFVFGELCIYASSLLMLF